MLGATPSGESLAPIEREEVRRAAASSATWPSVTGTRSAPSRARLIPESAAARFGPTAAAGIAAVSADPPAPAVPGVFLSRNRAGSLAPAAEAVTV